MEKIIEGYENYTIDEYGSVYTIERICPRTDGKRNMPKLSKWDTVNIRKNG